MVRRDPSQLGCSCHTVLGFLSRLISTVVYGGSTVVLVQKGRISKVTTPDAN